MRLLFLTFSALDIRSFIRSLPPCLTHLLAPPRTTSLLLQRRPLLPLQHPLCHHHRDHVQTALSSVVPMAPTRFITSCTARVRTGSS